MNWFKMAKDFRERNTINSKIRYLERLKEKLNIISNLIFQSGKNAKNTNYEIITSSKITSYPILHDILIEADVLALDSPWKFSILCKDAISEITRLIYSLKEERREITYGKEKMTYQKGL
jgi:hypothetical protein